MVQSPHFKQGNRHKTLKFSFKVTHENTQEPGLKFQDLVPMFYFLMLAVFTLLLAFMIFPLLSLP